MFKKLYLHLKNNGFNVYSIGQHEGVCIDPYIVISETGDSDIVGKNLMNKNVELLVYYPLGKYSEINNYIEKIKNTMKELSCFRRVINSNPIIVDDDKQAYMTFLAYRKIKLKER